jgi:hypothetical protein
MKASRGSRRYANKVLAEAGGEGRAVRTAAIPSLVAFTPPTGHKPLRNHKP